ncbi:MAG: hypothetical protein U0L72_05750, partial [Acutalibacteraceae bacterium]|nr:hypothetical protein [Acutalibacteraceae bacterium]
AVMPLKDYKNICDTIRTKTAITENIKSGEMPEKINAVYEAGAMPLYYAKKLDYLWNGVVFPENYEMSVRLKEISTIDYAFMESKNLKSVKLICDTPDTVISASGVFRECSQLELVDLTEFNRKFNNIHFCFYRAYNLKTIIGALDVSECTSFPNSTFSASALETIEFVPNTIKANIWFNNAPKLTHDSLMSIINGLKDYYTVVEKTYSGYFSFPPGDFGAWSVGTKYEITFIDGSNSSIGFIGDDSAPWGFSITDSTFPIEEVENATHFVVVGGVENGYEVIFFVPSAPTETHTLTLGTTNLAKLTDSEKAIATEKGWTLA